MLPPVSLGLGLQESLHSSLFQQLKTNRHQIFSKYIYIELYLIFYFLRKYSDAKAKEGD